tara:strand:- start:294 stop:1511 length:1218 start_codon:yes stop_codon:yes gene_type:complete
MAGNNNQQNEQGQPQTNPDFIFHGLNLGTITAVGKVSDFFNDDATNVISLEEKELSTTGPNPIANGAHGAMIQKCLRYPGYVVSHNNYNDSLQNPLDGNGALSQDQWNNKIATLGYEGSMERVVWSEKAFNNTWNWTTYYQLLLNHNRYLGFPSLQTNDIHRQRCREIIRGWGSAQAGPEINRSYEIISPDAPIIQTKILLRDWKNINTTTGDFVTFHWEVETNGNVNGLTGDFNVDYQLLDASGLPIPAGAFPGTTFGANLSGFFVNSQGDDFGMDVETNSNYVPWEFLYRDGLPTGAPPRLIIPFRKPLMVSADDLIPDGGYYGTGPGQDLGGELGFRNPRIFTYPKQDNKQGNNDDGAPNKGWSFGDEITEELKQAYITAQTDGTLPGGPSDDEYNQGGGVG